MVFTSIILGFIFSGTHCIYISMWVKKKFTLRKLTFIIKVSYERKVIIHVLKECYNPNRLVSFLYGTCSCLDEQEALFARVEKKSTCTKVLKWENQLNVSNEMHPICQKQSHTCDWFGFIATLYKTGPWTWM